MSAPHPGRLSRLRTLPALRALVTLVLTLLPGPAAACSACLSSPYGDRTFNWAFLGLLIMPFVVAAVIGGVLAHAYRRRRADRARLNLRIEETT